MQTMNESTVKKAQSAMQTQNKSDASSQLNAMSSELERMLALSEDLSKAQKARDVLDSGERLEELAQDLISNLESGKVDAETKKKVDEILEEAMENLAKM
jgi:signal transduction histidine kinase